MCSHVLCLDRDDDRVPCDLVRTHSRNTVNTRQCLNGSTRISLQLSLNQKAIHWMQYTFSQQRSKNVHGNPAKLNTPLLPWSMSSSLLWPLCCFTLIHSIPSTASSPSSHQPALWQIHLADTRYSAANPTAKCRWSKIWACLCSFSFTLGLSKRCLVQKNSRRAVWLSSLSCLTKATGWIMDEWLSTRLFNDGGREDHSLS